MTFEGSDNGLFIPLDQLPPIEGPTTGCLFPLTSSQQSIEGSDNRLFIPLDQLPPFEGSDNGLFIPLDQLPPIGSCMINRSRDLTFHHFEIECCKFNIYAVNVKAQHRKLALLRLQI